ncbi:MAG: hypothetical protein NTY35_07580 [Planctomycetota bacterium]|nr:hypothetical protein [Planctomycetota bacterium]
MAPRPRLASALFQSLDWRAALRQPRTWGILSRHMIPVAGVLFLGWSGIQAISLVALDTLAGVWCVVAVASVLVAREQWYAERKDLYSAVVGGVFVFALVAGLMTFMVGVVTFVLGGNILANADLEPRELLQDGWIFWAFGGLLAMQVPHFLTLSAGITEKTAKSVLEPRIGYLLRRLILAGMACSLLAFLWGKFALVGALLMTQLVLAAHEVFGDKLHATLFPEVAPATPTPAVAPPKSRRRRGRRG